MENLTIDDINRLQELTQGMMENNNITPEYRKTLQILDNKLADILGELQ